VSPQTSEERIEHYRQKAAALRTRANGVVGDEPRAVMLQVADGWDRLAELERACSPSRSHGPLPHERVLDKPP